MFDRDPQFFGSPGLVEPPEGVAEGDRKSGKTRKGECRDPSISPDVEDQDEWTDDVQDGRCRSAEGGKRNTHLAQPGGETRRRKQAGNAGRKEDCR
ncbi:MAG: hypothetical protein P0Y59_11780 [Candidatus Sphingomonas phytovorans]|nr:hypothetical protein [Sphingomonas sp.]WEK02326.1 MAG: hypothetical protein P0Y59_11780 [Sphingomonas sp.]